MDLKRYERWDSIGDVASEEYVATRDLQRCVEYLQGLCELSVDEKQFLEDLLSLQAEIGESAWERGTSLISEEEFRDYAEEYAIDLGYADRASSERSNPLLEYVDWDRWAEDLKNGYATIMLHETMFYYME